MNQIESNDCTLRFAAEGVTEPCPRERCVFWEPGGAVVEGSCVIDRLGAAVRCVDLAGYLLETRERFGHARDLAEAESARREFASRIGLEL